MGPTSTSKRKKRDVTYHWHICKALLSGSSRSRPHQTRLLVPWNADYSPPPPHTHFLGPTFHVALLSRSLCCASTPNDGGFGFGSDRHRKILTFRSSTLYTLHSSYFFFFYGLLKSWLLLFLKTHTQAYMCELHRHKNSFCLSVPRGETLSLSLSDAKSNMESELSRAGAMTDWLMRLSQFFWFIAYPFTHPVINIISWTNGRSDAFLIHRLSPHPVINITL